MPAWWTAKTEKLIRGFGFTLLATGLLGGAFWAMAGESTVRSILGTDLMGGGWMLRLHASLDPEVRDLDYFATHALPAGWRLFASLAVMGALLVWTVWPARLSEYLRRPADARTLALARVVIFGALAVYVSPAEVGRFAALPETLVSPPPGWEHLWRAMRPSPLLAELLGWLLRVTAVAAAVGLAPRVTAWAAALLALYVLGVPQFYGKVNHYHHLVWFTLILAASPAWDAWVLGVRRGGRSGATLRYGQPLRWIGLLIALMYFFPGFWKWVVAGPSWIDGSAFRTMVHAQWFREGWVPLLRPDVGLVGGLSGTLVLAFELGFLIALPWRGGRAVFVPAAVAFHLGVLLLAGINFWSLAVCLVVFVPLGRWLPEFGAPENRPAVSASRPGLAPGGSESVRPGPRSMVTILGAGWTVLAVLAGLTAFDSWPVAVYPTFAGLPDERYPTVIVEAGGERIDPYRSEGLREAFGQSRIMGLVWQLARDPTSTRAAAVVQVLASHEPRLAGTDSLRVMMVTLDVRPGSRQVLGERVLATLAAPRPE